MKRETYEEIKEYDAVRSKIRELNRLRKNCVKFPISDYFKLLETQDFKCKICSRPIKNSKTALIDHCHNTGVIRGLLCVRCNTGLGQFKDCPELLQKALEYLNNNNYAN